MPALAVKIQGCVAMYFCSRPFFLFPLPSLSPLFLLLPSVSSQAAALCTPIFLGSLGVHADSAPFFRLTAIFGEKVMHFFA